MSTSLAFFSDPGMSSPLARLDVLQATDGSIQVIDRVVYLGAPLPGRVFMAASDPGIDSILLSVASAGDGVSPESIRLALSADGLDKAVASDPLDLGPSILSGTDNAVAIHLRIALPPMPIGRYDNISFTTSTVIEAVI